MRKAMAAAMPACSVACRRQFWHLLSDKRSRRREVGAPDNLRRCFSAPICQRGDRARRTGCGFASMVIACLPLTKAFGGLKSSWLAIAVRGQKRTE